MKQFFIALIVALFAIVPAQAQCGGNNSAFKDGEHLNFDLYYNWAFVWVKVGTAEWNIKRTSYNNKPAFRTHLITSTNKRADKFFVMRDTLTSYTDLELIPLAFEKYAHEGSYYRVDKVLYSYPAGKCAVEMRVNKNRRGEITKKAIYNECIYDMVSMMQRARSYDVSNWKPGQRQYFYIADGSDATRQSIVYRGKKNVELDKTGETYRCLVFSFMEKEDGKEKEIVKFYISDDANHLPVRLDMNLNFGTAKAFLNKATNVRRPQTAIIKKK